ncbi:MAG: hypothetical protein JST19_08960 [Bacteroidetes bacterium]|nr:hypothetical protein [Bacteroidota bacterium]
MKHLFLFLFLATASLSAFAQFPLGSNESDIRAYFDKNVPYAQAIDFTTKQGINGICFSKVKVIGDYTFYFDENGNCDYYVITYDVADLQGVVKRLDSEYCVMKETSWESEDKTCDIALVMPKGAENYFSVIYFKPVAPGQTSPLNRLASN